MVQGCCSASLFTQAIASAERKTFNKFSTQQVSLDTGFLGALGACPHLPPQGTQMFCFNMPVDLFKGDLDPAPGLPPVDHTQLGPPDLLRNSTAPEQTNEPHHSSSSSVSVSIGDTVIRIPSLCIWGTSHGQHQLLLNLPNFALNSHQSALKAWTTWGRVPAQVNGLCDPKQVDGRCVPALRKPLVFRPCTTAGGALCCSIAIKGPLTALDATYHACMQRRSG